MDHQNNMETKISDENESPPIKRFGIRHLQMAAMTFTMISLFVARGSMAVAVLAMAGDGHNNQTSVAVYEWDKQIQSIILSSFFWGYVIMQIPAGILAKRFGGKPILLVALLLNGCLCLLLPTLAAVGGWPLVCASRVAMGLSQACLFPATHTLLGQWFPTNERTSLSGIVYGGVQLGIIIAMPVSGVLADTDLGWKLIFYTMSVLLFLTSAVWYWCAASDPADHRMISKPERHYIESSLNSSTAHSTMPTPWKQILTTIPVLAMIPTHIGAAMSFTLFFVDMPTYLEKGLQISLKDSASLSALPYVGMWIGNTASTIIAEKLINKKILSIIVCRKVFNSIGLFGTAAGLLVLSFLGPENKELAIVTLVVTLTLLGFLSAGYVVNYLDLSPNFAGVLFSFTNFIANFGSILMPILTGLILRNDSTDVSRWRIVFLLMAAITSGTNFIYILFGSSERQAWNDPDYFDKKQAEPEEMVPVISSSPQKEFENVSIKCDEKTK